MNIQSFFRNIINHLRSEPDFPDELALKLIARLENTQDDELSCDELFALIDEYAEARLSGEQAARLHPLITHHLEMCSECDDEFQALMSILSKKILS